MFKTTACAAACACAFVSFSASAADVTLYGNLDVGLGYTRTAVIQAKPAGRPATDTPLGSANTITDSWQMTSRGSTPSFFGLRGSEDLGNGLKAGFRLESGINPDTGAMSDSQRLFNRESTVSLTAGGVSVAFGRMGTLKTGVGSTGLNTVRMSAFGVDGMGPVQGLRSVMGGEIAPFDNMIDLRWDVTPAWTLHAQYSGSMNSNYKYDPNEPGGSRFVLTSTSPNAVTPAENTAKAHVYASVGTRYQTERFTGLVIADYLDYSNMFGSRDHSVTNPADDEYHRATSFYSLTAMAAWQPAETTYYAMAHAFKGAQIVGGNQLDLAASRVNGRVICYGTGSQGYSAMLGVKHPVLGGNLRAQAGYLYAEAGDGDTAKADNKGELHRLVLGVGYDYALSRRTTVYAGVGYMRDHHKFTAVPHGYYYAAMDDAYQISGTVGLRHTF